MIPLQMHLTILEDGMNINNKTVIVTGASGLVGVPTVEKCIDEGAAKVYAVDIRLSEQLDALCKKHSEKIIFLQRDLTYLSNCESLFEDRIDIVLHVAGIKGNPSKATSQPADYLFPMLMFNTNMIKASYDANVDWFVYLSSVGVYHPSPLMREDDVWTTMPGKNDWYPGWTKRMGELTLETLKIQHGWDRWTIIRPSNIYGINDYFAEDATVIGSNIWRIFNTTSNELTCWGDGSSLRDFVFGSDVAQATVDVVKKEVSDIINFGSGQAVSIKETIEAIVDNYKHIMGKDKRIVWDTDKPNGDPVRCLSADRQIKYDILPKTTLSHGLLETMLHYKKTYVK